ncbi:MAG: hypothetical protein H0T69_04895 [Thermoleophilaceae bacterium]|nr:hypothetical protein [Thermoleophilaceae bacterium]
MHNNFRALRPEYVAACNGNILDALILDQFNYLTSVHDDWFWYSYTQLARALFDAPSKRTLTRAIDRLEKAGLIEVRHKSAGPQNSTNEYRLTKKLHSLVTDWHQCQNGSSDRLAPDYGQNGTSTSAKVPLEGDRMAPHRRHKETERKRKDTPGLVVGNV